MDKKKIARAKTLLKEMTLREVENELHGLEMAYQPMGKEDFKRVYTGPERDFERVYKAHVSRMQSNRSRVGLLVITRAYHYRLIRLRAQYPSLSEDILFGLLD